MSAAREEARVFTLPPGVPFLRALADAILAGGFPEPDRPAPGAVELSDWRVLVPTRRAARAFAEAFLESAPSGALLLPRVASLGDVDEDELLLAGVPELGALDVPPAISGLARRLILARFILEWRHDRPDGIRSPVQALHLAGELARLVDAVETEQADWSALEGLVGREFALHWDAVIDFLEMLRARLPEELARRGEINPMARRNLLMTAHAEDLAARGAAGPVVAAGSTGSIPATAELLRTISGLSTGAIVLPGLDRHMGEKSWRAVGPNHPQYGMKQLLQRIGVDRSEVRVLPGISEDPGRAARNRLASETVRPAATTDEWAAALAGDGASDFADAVQGLHLIAAPAQREEALAIALVIRETLETPGRTVALVTPDRGLARRVSSELGRWDIVVDDSAGLPLAVTPEGGLATLVIEAAASGFAPVELLAVIKHPLAAFGRERGEILRLARKMEMAALRGTVSPRGFGALKSALARARADAARESSHAHPAVRAMSEEDWQALDSIVDELRVALEPLAEALTQAGADAKSVLAAHVGALEAASLFPGSDAPRIWRNEGGEALGELFVSLLEASDLVPELGQRDYGPFLANLMASHPVRPHGRAHARVQIWGLLEARLLQADVMILGALNEGVWPRTDSPDPFLNRPMRAEFGLEPPERRIGLSAHDFVQCINAAHVYLTWSEKIDGAPVGPSRWVLRLQMLMRASGRVGDTAAQCRHLSWALGIDHAEARRTMARPEPRPEVRLRPRKLSVTQIEEWTRDPYATYARHVLKLEPVGPLATDPGVAERGTLVHDVLHRYAEASYPVPPGDPLQALIATGRELFGAYLEFPEVAAFWWNRFERIADWLIESGAFEVGGVTARLTEVRGRIEIPAPFGPFELRARADRMDVSDEGAVIFDYKTGAVPSEKQMASRLKPQMPLEAAIAMQGGFEGLERVPVRDLVHVKLSGGRAPGEWRPLKKHGAAELGQMALDGLTEWIARFDVEEMPYRPREVPEFESWAGDFDHLSRYSEWSRAGGNGGGP